MMGIPVLAFGLLSLIVIVWPVARICRRIGFSPWFGLLAILPFGNVVLLWVLAYVPWPIDGSGSGRWAERGTA